MAPAVSRTERRIERKKAVARRKIFLKMGKCVNIGMWRIEADDR